MIGNYVHIKIIGSNLSMLILILHYALKGKNSCIDQRYSYVCRCKSIFVNKLKSIKLTTYRLWLIANSPNFRARLRFGFSFSIYFSLLLHPF